MLLSMTRSLGRPPRGLTLIEFLFATSVMAFVLLGVAAMFPAAFRTVVSGGQDSKAFAFIQEMMEMIALEPFDDIIVEPSSTNGYKGYKGFNSKTTISQNSCPPATGVFDPSYNKRKWKCDLVAETAQASGKGLAGGFGTVAVTCVNADGSVNSSTPCPTDLRRVVVTVTWGGQVPRTLSQTTNVARH